MTRRQIILGVVVLLIVSSILYLESQKAARFSPQEAVEVAPEIPAVDLKQQTFATEGKQESETVSGEDETPSKKPLQQSQVTKEAAKKPPVQAVQQAAKTVEEKTKKYERAKEITTPDGFINVDSITVKEVVGKKVILVDFWTYSCINCQRTTPYLNAWWQKYKDKGLVIIGVHTPEFQFEEKYENVLAATKKFNIKYPVVLDNDYSTWTAYRNRYWPRKYLIDIDGFIVYDHIGEGAYEETERKIQELLQERMARLDIKGSVASKIEKPVLAPTVEFSKVGSPEVYFGSARNTLLGNGMSLTAGVQSFAMPEQVNLNTLYLVGDWTIQEEFAQNQTPQAKIIFRYRAKDVYFVANAEQQVALCILRDGKPAGVAGGEDVKQENGASVVRVQEDRLYHLVDDPAGYAEHTLEIIVETPGLRAFTFTFG